MYKGKNLISYNQILRVWVLDPFDYFLLSTILGSIVVSRLKDYLSEIKKSELVRQSDRSISNSKKIKKIYKFALENRGGQLEQF